MTYEVYQPSIGSAESNNSTFGEIHCERQNGERQERQNPRNDEIGFLPSKQSSFDAHLLGVASLLGIFICKIGGGYLTGMGLEIAAEPSYLFALFLYGGYIVMVFGSFGCFLLWFFRFQSFPL